MDQPMMASGPPRPRSPRTNGMNSSNSIAMASSPAWRLCQYVSLACTAATTKGVTPRFSMPSAT